MLLIFSLPAFLSFAPAQNPKKTYAFYEVPRFDDKLVHDDAGVLTPETIAHLEQTLRNLEDSTGYQVGVLILYDLQGLINSYARRVIQEWELGRKKEQGVLMLIIQKQREVRIEVGKGLIEVLTPEECQKIIDHEIIPNFKEEQYNEGSLAAVNGIITGLGGAYEIPEAKDFYKIVFYVISGIVILASCVGLFSKSYFIAAYAGLIPFYGVLVGPTLSWWVAGAFVVVFPLARWLIVKSKMKLLTFGELAKGDGSGDSYDEDEYDRMTRRNAMYDSSDSSCGSSSSSSSDDSGASGRW